MTPDEARILKLREALTAIYAAGSSNPFARPHELAEAARLTLVRDDRYGGLTDRMEITTSDEGART